MLYTVSDLFISFDLVVSIYGSLLWEVHEHTLFIILIYIFISKKRLKFHIFEPFFLSLYGLVCSREGTIWGLVTYR